MGFKDARKHLELARKQWEKSSVDSWEPAEPASCVSNAFYAYENLIVAVAECHGKKWKRNHYDKAELARQLAKEGILKTDIGDILLRLNDLRKDVSYGEPGPELAEADLDDFVADLEIFVDEVETVVTTREHASHRKRT